jgi:hypothetical protein
MSFIKKTQIDPKDYQFKNQLTPHLDTDELRHTIKPIITHVAHDCMGQEHMFCDKEQLNTTGQYRRPKVMMEADRRGFKTALEMYMADKNAEDTVKQKDIADLKVLTTNQNVIIQELITKQNTLEQKIQDQNNLLQQILNKLS